ncbi:hypothetical protein ACWEKM_22580 [Streptomyces sp. NPDC004752]
MTSRSATVYGSAKRPGGAAVAFRFGETVATVERRPRNTLTVLENQPAG